MGYDMRYRRKDEAEQAAVSAAADQFHAACRERDALPEHEKGRFNPQRARELGDWDSHEVFDGRSDRYRAAQDKVHALYEAMRDAEKSYFRLNISGMGWACSVMDRFGMAFEDPSERPEWPKPDDYGVTDDEVSALEYPEDYPDLTWTDETLRAACQFKADQDKILSWHGVEVPGIPFHKFSSNDGWIVLPAEAEAAVRIWKQQYDEMGEDEARAIVAAGSSRSRNELPMSAEDADAYWSLWLRWVAFLAGSVRRDGFEVH